MNITNQTIKDLKPCQDRHDNYLKFYKDKSYTPKQFLGLKNITHEDKLWVAFRLLPKENIILAAADIAELVLPIFEVVYPNDKRPRLAIEAARSKTMTLEEKRTAAYYASNTTYYAHATAHHAAHYASYAATNAATCATTAANAAFAASSSANAAFAARLNGNNIEKKIRTIILRYWK